jgi:hypothetical protein
MKRTNIHLRDDQRDWLRSHGEAVGNDPAAIVREAIDRYRQAHERRNDRRATALTRERRKGKR